MTAWGYHVRLRSIFNKTPNPVRGLLNEDDLLFQQSLKKVEPWWSSSPLQWQHMEGQANTSWDSAMSDLTVALEASFSCPKYFTQLSKQKADRLIMGPVRQE